MDLTEDLAKRCRVILYFIFESRARIGHGALTALVVMLYNALRLSLVPPRGSWRHRITTGKGTARAPAVGFFAIKYDGPGGEQGSSVRDGNSELIRELLR